MDSSNDKNQYYRDMQDNAAAEPDPDTRSDNLEDTNIDYTDDFEVAQPTQ